MAGLGGLLTQQRRSPVLTARQSNDENVAAIAAAMDPADAAPLPALRPPSASSSLELMELPKAGEGKIDFSSFSSELSSLLSGGNLAEAGSNLGSVVGGLVGLFDKNAGSKIEEGLSKAGRLMNDPYSKKLIGQAMGTGVNMLGNVINAGIGFKNEYQRGEEGSFSRAFGSAISELKQGGLDFLFNKKNLIAGASALKSSFK